MPKSVAQAKFTIDSDIYFAFKARCEAEGVSMASVISQFMKTNRPTKVKNDKIDTRPQRKCTVQAYIGLLENLMDMEERYRDAIPEQFESRYEAADHSCDQLEQAISCLEDAY